MPGVGVCGEVTSLCRWGDSEESLDFLGSSDGVTSDCTLKVKHDKNSEDEVEIICPDGRFLGIDVSLVYL